jgi:steroid 5-alpha reductase family enzyme
VRDDLQNGADRRYVRYDQRMSKQVYRAQIIRDVFGSKAARIFMNLMRVDALVAQRVLLAPMEKLRR